MTTIVMILLFHSLLFLSLVDVVTCLSAANRARFVSFSSAISSSSGRRGVLAPLFASTLSFPNNTSVTDDARSIRKQHQQRRQKVDDRFLRTAPKDTVSEKECILNIDGISYNITTWAKAHPGGVRVLHKFHNKDASKAFHAVDHSAAAHAMLKDFAVTTTTGTTALTAPTLQKQENNNIRRIVAATACPFPSLTTTTTLGGTSPARRHRTRPRWQQKLFTKEDPIGVHKYLGIFCLLHFVFRFFQMYFGDISAGLGTRLGKGPSVWPALCVLPHGLLSVSSLIFHTVPRERVVGKPMIWQEYRVHNIVFGLRSVICTLLAWSYVYFPNTTTKIAASATTMRRLAVWGSCATALAANLVADAGTRRLRANTAESTTATMPYWEGCSIQTQQRFKLFYAYCQFMATLACIAVCNPAWGLAVLLAIQMASVLMTLVRKGLLSPKGYHVGYTIALLLPYYIGFRSHAYMGPLTFPLMMLGGGMLFQLRRLGLNKYCLWLPIYAARILVGDQWIPYNVW